MTGMIGMAGMGGGRIGEEFGGEGVGNRIHLINFVLWDGWG